MNEEAVEPQNEPIENMIEEAMPDDHESHGVENEEPTQKMIPLSVAQKLREKKKELELELQFERQERQRLLNQYNSAHKSQEEDDDEYETATRKDLRESTRMSQEETIRAVEERLWIKQNPEKYEMINEFLPKLLKQRPNLAPAIEQAPNRYEEAYAFMEAFSPKQKQAIRQAQTPKKDAPNAPGGVPKSAVMNESIDVMRMTDAEFAAWRSAKRKAR